MKLIILILSVVFISPVSAEILTWVDDQGNVNFGDEIPEKYKAQGNTVELEALNVVKTVQQEAKFTGNWQNGWGQVKQNSQDVTKFDLEQYKAGEESRRDARDQQMAEQRTVYEKAEEKYNQERPCPSHRDLPESVRKQFRKQCKRDYIYGQM